MQLLSPFFPILILFVFKFEKNRKSFFRSTSNQQEFFRMLSTLVNTDEKQPKSNSKSAKARALKEKLTNRIAELEQELLATRSNKTFIEILDKLFYCAPNFLATLKQNVDLNTLEAGDDFPTVAQKVNSLFDAGQIKIDEFAVF